jgi:uncharacterized protein (DUF111 family)
MIYIDCREGLSGDMILASLLGLIAPERRMEIAQGMAGAADRRGIAFNMLDIEECGEAGLGISYSTRRGPSEETSYADAFSVLDSLSSELGSKSALPGRALGMIFEAEAEAHSLPAREVHLHELGRPQALLNLAGIGLAHSELVSGHAEEFVASTITTGKGTIVVSHGAVRVPAPASLILLRGLKHQAGDDPGERATPSGIAAVKAMIGRQSDQPPANPKARSVGFGTKRFGGRLGRTMTLRG